MGTTGCTDWRRLGHWLALHIRGMARRACDTSRRDGLGEAVSRWICACRRVLVALHRAHRGWLRRKGITSADGTDGAGRRRSIW